MSSFGVIVPVGPSPSEIERTTDLLDSLWAHEVGASWVVLVDDGGRDRNLAARFAPPGASRVVSLLNPPRPRRAGLLGGLCTSMLLALSWLHRYTDGAFALRLDTDALVIAPFAGKLHRAFATMPDVGVAGSFDRTCNGEPRDFSPHHRALCRLLSPWRVWGRRAIVRRLVETALERGYQLGEHCLGGAFAVSAEMVDRMAGRGYLDDPLLWNRAGCPDDVMLGIYARAVGMRCANLTREHEPFGLKFVGLPDTPDRLLARGFSIIHSIKNDARVSEEDIRAFYRCRRAGGERRPGDGVRRSAARQ